jgi:glycosyltransferase involved in cell wall biosynthesis
MRFLNICGYSERKGMRTLIKGFLKEFDSKEDVELWIFGGWYSEQKAQEEIDELKRDIQKASFPKIILDWSDRRDEEMPGLFNSFDAGVFGSKGEGYGRPLAECAACEVPVITTAHAPMTEIITKDTGYLIDVDHLGPEPRADWICDLYKGADFVHPSEKSLREQMRDVYDDYEKAEAKAKRGREYILQHHNTATCVETAITRLREIQQNQVK